MLAIVDAGPLYAVADADDDDHDVCLSVLRRLDLELVIPALVVAEATYLIGSRLGPQAEAQFLDGLEVFEVEAPLSEDWRSIAALVRRYGDFPLGGTDASVAVLANRLQTDLIVTVDHRHFRALRSHAGKPFTLLPG